MSPSNEKSFLTATLLCLVMFAMIAWSASTGEVSAAQSTDAATVAAASLTPTPRTNTSGTVPCPNLDRPVVTITPSNTVAPRATATGTQTPRPTNVVVSGIFEATQESVFDIIHAIVDYTPGVGSGWAKYQGPLNVIVLDGELTVCLGGVQRIYTANQSFTAPVDQWVYLINTNETTTARISLVRIRPQTTPTAGATDNATANATNPAPAATATVPLNESTFLGVQLAAVGTNLRVLSLTAGGPAASAGLQVGDMITAIDGRTVASLVASGANTNDGYAYITAFFQVLATHNPGDKVILTVQRGSTTSDITVTLGAKTTP